MFDPNSATSLTELERAIAALKTSSRLLNNSKTGDDQDVELQRALRDACIQRFVFCVELSWKTAVRALGLPLKSPNTAIREMARNGLIDDPKLWLAFVVMRNKTSLTYDETVAEEVFKVTQDSIRHFEMLVFNLKKLLK